MRQLGVMFLMIGFAMALMGAISSLPAPDGKDRGSFNEERLRLGRRTGRYLAPPLLAVGAIMFGVSFM